MLERAILVVLLAGFASPFAYGDWHDHLFDSHRGGGGAPADPQLESCVVGAMLIVAAASAVLVIGGPLLVLAYRRISLWVVPLVNSLLYIASIGLRPYPGGFTARFQPPGLWYTLAEFILLLVVILIIVTVIAVLRWIVSKVRTGLGRVEHAGPRVDEP